LRKFINALLIVLGSMVGMAAAGLIALYSITNERLNRTYTVPNESLVIPAGEAAIERGRYLVENLGICTDCHGENYSGQVFDDGPFVGRLTVKNITSGKGGIPPDFSDADWVRALRHGIGPDGKALLDMPANIYTHFGDADLGAMIAYLKSLPPVDNVLPPKQIGPMARFFILQRPEMLPAEMIDHDAPRPPDPTPAETVEYGAYLAQLCKSCHGEDYSGSQEPGGGLNLTPGGDLKNWTESDFQRTIRQGVNPAGKHLDPEMMPWQRLGRLTDSDLRAIWLFIRSLPAVNAQ
jgi:mono/diheme cytochrome c family protein